MSAGPTRAVKLHSLLLSRTQNMQVFDNDCKITTPNENKTTGGARRIVSIIKLGQHRWHNYCIITNIKHLHVCKLMFKKSKTILSQWKRTPSSYQIQSPRVSNTSPNYIRAQGIRRL